MTDERYNQDVDAVYKALAWSEGGPYGDVQMSAHRAAILAVGAIRASERQRMLMLVSARDLDDFMNGEGQDSWAAEGRLRDAMEEFALATGRAQPVVITPEEAPEDA